MRVRDIQIQTLSFPLQRPITTNIRTFEKIDAIFLSLHDETGLVGNSFIRILGEMSCEHIITYIKEIYSLMAHSAEPLSLSIWSQKWHHYRPQKTKNEIDALAAIDIAIWDLIAKKEHAPLCKIIGNASVNNTILVYGTTGWLSFTESELVAECKRYAALGINGFKIRLGSPNDYARVKAVRDTMGSDYKIMLDANERYTVAEAIAVAKIMENLHIEWLEEPVKTSVQDLLEVKHNSPIRIAAGENIFTVADFAAMCAHHAVDILQPDIIRCGGITGFLEIAKCLAEYNMPMCNHLLPELSITLLSQFNNSYYLEYDDLFPMNIFTQDFSIKNGCMFAPQIPGTGVAISQATLENYSVPHTALERDNPETVSMPLNAKR